MNFLPSSATALLFFLLVFHQGAAHAEEWSPICNALMEISRGSPPDFSRDAPADSAGLNGIIIKDG